jgi:anaerobic magnesium-protoporphyrin IX monomethyl ester cyclase
MNMTGTDILLINPAQGLDRYSFPWGTVSLGSYLTRIAGRRAHLLDGNISSPEEVKDGVREYCRSNPAGLIGIYCMSTDTAYVKALVDFIKGISAGTKVILGGPHAMLQPEQTCAYRNIDFVAYGEGEHTLETLLHTGVHRCEEYEKVPGLVFKREGRIYRTPAAPPIGFYDIDYDLVPETMRKTFPSYIQILTGRGCSFRCTFCFNTVVKQTWRSRPVADFMREAERVVEKYGSRVIYFRDENFFSSKARVREFIDTYRSKGFTFKWRTSLRASYFHENFVNLDLLRELADINCQTLKFGLESGSQRVLDMLNKGYRLEKVYGLIRAMAKVPRIHSNYSFMIGLPGETYEEYLRTLRLISFIHRQDKEAFIIGPQYFRLYPGGELYETVKTRYHISEPSTFEGWAEKYDPEKDPYRSYKTARYPWVEKKHAFFAAYADKLVFLYRQRVRDYLRFGYFLLIPFILLAKMRVTTGWYGCLWDLRCFVWVSSFRKRSRVLKKLFDNSFIRLR